MIRVWLFWGESVVKRTEKISSGTIVNWLISKFINKVVLNILDQIKSGILPSQNRDESDNTRVKILSLHSYRKNCTNTFPCFLSTSLTFHPSFFPFSFPPPPDFLNRWMEVPTTFLCKFYRQVIFVIESNHTIYKGTVGQGDERIVSSVDFKQQITRRRGSLKIPRTPSLVELEEIVE